MDVITTPPYADLQRLYNKYFSIGYLNTDISSKFALISLVCFLKHKISQKQPDVTHYQIIKKIIGDKLPEDFIKGLAVVCSDFAYGCKEFPEFGIAPKDMPKKVKELLLTYMPF